MCVKYFKAGVTGDALLLSNPKVAQQLAIQSIIYRWHKLAGLLHWLVYTDSWCHLQIFSPGVNLGSELRFIAA